MLNDGAPQLACGFAASCGVLLMLAGASKVYRGGRGIEADPAIRRALRIPRPRWQRLELAAGGFEAVAGAVVCAGAFLGPAPVTLTGGAAPGWAWPWFPAGAAAGGGVLVLLGVARMPRTPACHRPLWFPARATLRALAGHGVYEAMAGSAGPFGPEVRYRRTGCTEEFWFTPASPPGTPQHAVVFQTRYPGPGAPLAVQASLRGIETSARRRARQ